MIEISTPIQAQNSFESVQENVSEISVFGENSPQKGKAGLFLKLLEGLTGKTKGKIKGLAESGEFHQSEDPLAVNQTKKEGLLGSKTDKKLLQTGKTPFLAGEPGEQEAVFPMLSDLQGYNQGLNAIFSMDEAESAESVDLANTLLKQGASGKNYVLSTEFTRFNIEGQENQNLQLKNALFGEDGETQAAFQINGANGKGKNGRGALDALASARNIENGESKVFGELRNLSADLQSSIAAQMAENREATKLRDARNNRNREKLNIEVRDLRSPGSQTPAETIKTPVNAVFQTERVNAELKAELSAEFRNAFSNSSSSSDVNGLNARSPGAGFEEALSRELRTGLGSDIVRESVLILKNGGEGIIRLSLKPEALGNVKIRVEMTENKITGHIVVESSEAFKAFERELPVLEKQFQDSGFSEAKLDMTFAGEGGAFGAEAGQDKEETQKFSQVLAASRYDAGSESRDAAEPNRSEYSETGRAAVNMLI